MKPFEKCPENKIVFFICLLFLISLNLSFTWPFENVRITSTFGESRGDHFHNGIDIISGYSKIYPADEGELVFFWDNSIFPTENYPGGGNFKILTHKNGYYSVYMHLADSPLYKNVYAKNDPVGDMGLTGHSSGKHLHMSMVEINSKKIINPLLIFPKIPDNIKPDIEEAYVRIDDK
jgi:murein DD-endopeptidase MepM/ murein hydrolase activator NlpD